MTAWEIPRPATLAEVARRALRQEPIDPLIREFLDEFYLGDAASRTAAIAEEPPRIGRLPDAYLAGIAEHLARCFDLPIPEWVDAPDRFLDKPFFAGGMEGLKALLIVESPTAFRRRLIFVSRDALSRPRDPNLAPLRDANEKS